jgi:hypothetical protein
MCSHCLFPVVVTSLEQVITLLYKFDDDNRLVTRCSNKNKVVPNKLLRACCHYQFGVLWPMGANGGIDKHRQNEIKMKEN